MINLISQLVHDEGGQDLAEYGIALAVIGLGAGAAAFAIAGSTTTLWTNASAVVAAAV